MSVQPNFNPTPSAPTVSTFFSGSSVAGSVSFGHTDIGQKKGSHWKLTPGHHSNLQAMYGATWYDLRRLLKIVFTSRARDPIILQKIKEKVNRYIPVRSGQLANYIFETMTINRASWYSTHYMQRFSFNWHPDYPFPIPGRVQHKPPDEGYGPWGSVHLTHTIPNVNMIHVSRTGISANYALNDPTALNNPVPEIERVAQQEIAQDMIDFFDGAVLTLGI